MNTYYDRYARFGVLIGSLVGVAIIAIISLVSSCSEPENTAYTLIEAQPMNTYFLCENGYIGIDSENTDWCDQFIDFSHDDIQITGQVGDDYIEIFLRDTSTGVMARIAGDNVSSLALEVK